jgi:hypothetical protein
MLIRFSKKFAVAAALAMGAGAASTANAALINFTYSGVASGTLNGTAFNSAAFTTTASGLTEQRTNNGLYGGYSIEHFGSSTTINIAGFNSCIANTALFTQTDPEGGIALVSGAVNGNYVLIANTPVWNMLSSLPAAPYTVGYPGGGQGPIISTTLGGLRFTSFSSPLTFGATVVPAPGAIVLLGVSGLAKRRRR